MQTNKPNNTMFIALFLLVFLVYFLSLSTCFYTPIEWEIVKVAKDAVSNFVPVSLVAKLAETIESPMRILPRFSHMVDYLLWRANPIGWHFTNVFIHMANAVLLFIFLRLLFKSNIFAFFSAVVFAVHPINFHTVQWLGSRFNLLNMSFYLLALIMFLKFAIKGGVTFYLASIFFAICAYLSEEAALLLPASIILTDILFFDAFSCPQRFLKKIWVYLPYLILSFSFILFMFRFSHSSSFGSETLRLSPLVLGFPDSVFCIDWPRQIAHIISTLFSPIFRDFILAPWSTCRYSMIKSGSRFSSIIYNGAFFFIMIFSLAAKMVLKKKVDLQVLAFSFCWIFTTAIIFLGSSLDFRILLSETRHLYIPSIGFSCLLVSMFVDRNSVLLSKNNLVRLQLILFFLIIFNFMYRTEELVCSLKMSTARTMAFISEFTSLAKKIPQGSNVYFINNVYEDGICAFIFSNYIQDMRAGVYYYGFSGTDLILEKLPWGKRTPLKQCFKAKAGNFESSLLESGQNDYLYGLGHGVQQDKLVSLSEVFGKRGKTRGLYNIILAFKSREWRSLKSAGTLAPVSMLLSSKVTISADSVEKIKITMKTSLNFEAEPMFTPLKNKDQSLLRIDPTAFLPRQFFPLGKVMIGFYWITDKDNSYDDAKLISFPVEADGIFHEYEIYPPNCFEWVHSGDIIQIGLGSSSVPSVFKLEMQVESLEIISSQPSLTVI